MEFMHCVCVQLLQIQRIIIYNRNLMAIHSSAQSLVIRVRGTVVVVGV